MKINRMIFREYDIRGIYGQDIDGELFFHIGKAVGTIYRRKNLSKIVLGMDNRSSSPELTQKISEGLQSTGCNVTFVGTLPYPLIHFYTTTKDFDGGVYITASHNTKEYNGVKIEYAKAAPIYGEGVQEIANIIESENYETGTGSYVEKDFTEEYIKFVKDSFSFSKKFRIVLNTGNGSTGDLARKVFTELGLELVPVNLELDGTFPNGTPDPEEPHFVEQTTSAVLASGADAGFGLDGDGDRFLMVDEKGKSYETDRALLLFSKYILREFVGAKIAYDVKCTSLAEDIIKNYGGIPQIIRTGRSFFIQKITMKEATFGVEFSGHTYFGDKYFGYDDGIYAICRTLEIMDKEKSGIHGLMKEFPERKSTPEIKVPCPDTEKFTVVFKIIEEVKNSEKFSRKSFVDGVRANISNTAWFLIRAKNTSPFLGIRIEAADEQELEKVKNEVRQLLEPHSLDF